MVQRAPLLTTLKPVFSFWIGDSGRIAKAAKPQPHSKPLLNPVNGSRAEAIETELGHIACHIKGVDVCILCQKLSPGTGRTECRLVHRPHPLGCVYIHSFAWHARYMAYGVFFSLFLSTCFAWHARDMAYGVFFRLFLSGGQNRPVNCLKNCYKVSALNKK